MEVLAPIYGLDSAAAEAVTLEQAGVDGVFAFEGPHDVFLPLALAAAATDLAVMSNVAIAFPRNAVHLAHTARDLQALSNGRFTLGLGAQVRSHVERRFGVAFDRPVARMRDTVEAVRAVFSAWETGAPLDHRGEFRQHTLMTPMFSPGPSPWGPPPIVVGGLGPQMCALAAEVADGLAVMPVTSDDFFDAVTMPAVELGASRRSPSLGPFTVLPEVIVCCGRNEAELAAADAGCRALLGFYVSTPAYRPVIDRAGYPDLQPEAQALTRAGRWDELASLIDDTLLNTLTVRGAPADIAAQVARRYQGRATSICIYLPYAAADGLVAEVVDLLHGV
ncbi:MAG: TIGR03617 family F420-dependent LLM class oxidoreductase [Actinomycetes bacterium]